MPRPQLAPMLKGTALIVIVLGASACSRGSVAPTPAAPAPKPMTGPEMRRAYFYSGKPYGSEAQFNPLSAILNNGFDQVRTGPERRVLEFDYRMGATGNWQSIIHAQRLVRVYGTSEWVKGELLPLSGKGGGGGQWVPNYQLHLFGSGATYVRLIAWNEQHGITHPRIAAGTTFWALHFLNELIENTALVNGSVDAMTDLLIFDPASILLWNSDKVQQFVGSRIEFTEWPGQPTFGLPGRTIENTFQTAVVRVRLPRSTNWRAFTTMGGSYMGGLSRRVGDSTWWSLGAGGDASRNPVIDTLTGRKTVELLGNVGVFVDRSGSLLASLVLKAGFDAGATLNVYPGVIRDGKPRFGVRGQWLRSRQLRFGLSTALGVGLGRNP